MKTMKSLIVSLGLLIGLVGVSHAGGRLGAGWIVTQVTGTAADITYRHCFLKSIILSSGPTTGDTGFAIALETGPVAATGAGEGPALFGGVLFQSTAAASPYLLFQNTTTVSNAGNPLNVKYTPADGDNQGYTEHPGLFIRQSQESRGGANVITVIWSN